MTAATRLLFATALVAFVTGGGLGWSLAHRGQTQAAPIPDDWVARIDDTYISGDAFIDEMRRRGGERPGQFQDMEQKRQLLDDMVYRAALVKAAENAGLTNQPDLQRTLESIVANHYLQGTLRLAEREVQVSDDAVREYYEKHADDYVVPARQRVAMLKISVPTDAGETAWSEAEARLSEARTRAQALETSVPHFGTLAREYSDDAASRWRGGVIGWISEGRTDRYAYDAGVIAAARKLERAGQLSDVFRGKDGVYLVRLVESEPRQSRGLDQLASGIRQRLVQDRLAAAEQQFRQRLMRQVGVEVREAALASIAPLSGPGQHNFPQPPAMPSDEG